MAVTFEHPALDRVLSAPGLTVMKGAVDHLLQWGATNSLWVFPMATSCCGIELMAAAASRVDLDRMGTIVRGTPRQADVMVVAGTITTKMAPRVRALWEQMPEPKWCIAMGSCAISGDFYRNLYSVVPGIDTFLPVDVYVPGCPPNPEALMHGLLRLQEKVRRQRAGEVVAPERPRDEELSAKQEEAAARASSVDRSDEDEVAVDEPPVAAIASDTDGDFDIAPLLQDAPPIVETARHLDVARKLRALGFREFVYVVATHFPEKAGAKPQPERFEVAYALRAVGKNSRVASWRLKLAPGEHAPSLVGVFAGADWQEREQFDLVGVRFAGHPDPRRILLADDFEGHPLRKDFPADKAHPPWR